MGTREQSAFVALDEALRRLVSAAQQSSIAREPIRLAKRLLMPARRALIGPRLDGDLQRLASHLAANWPAPPSEGRPLRVGLLCIFGDEPVGGIPVWTRMLGAALARQGHRVCLFHLERKDGVEVSPDGLEFVPVAAPPLRRWPALPDVPGWLQDYQRAICSAVLLRHAEEPFDLVSGPIWFSEPLALLRTRALPVAVSLHTSQAMMTRIGSTMDEETRALVLAEHELLADAQLIIGNSEAAAADIMAATDVPMDRRRLRVVPHGLPDKLDAIVSEPQIRQWTKLLFVGRLEYRKGIDTLFEAIPQLADLEATRFSIAGSPSDSDPVPDFQNRYAAASWLNRVQFLRGVDDNAKWRLIASSDIMVIPSRYESFGLVAVEAMMFGKPVISTRVGGIPEVVEDGVTGILVPPGDAEALAAAMRRLVEDAELRARMGAAGRERYLAKFTDTAMADAWVAAVRDGLARLAERQ